MLVGVRQDPKKQLVLGLVLLAVFVALQLIVNASYDALRRDGVTVPGVIVADWSHRFDNDLEVQYVADSRHQIGEVGVDSPLLGPTYRDGEQVAVLYDPNDPSHMTIRGQDGHPDLDLVKNLSLLGGGGYLLWSLIGLLRRCKPRLRSADQSSVQTGD